MTKFNSTSAPLRNVVECCSFFIPLNVCVTDLALIPLSVDVECDLRWVVGFICHLCLLDVMYLLLFSLVIMRGFDASSWQVPCAPVAYNKAQFLFVWMAFTSIISTSVFLTCMHV